MRNIRNIRDKDSPVIESISQGLYRIEVPLPKSPLKALNAYFIKGEKRNLLIDNGFNRPECRDALFSALHELNPSQTATDYFITHGHADHAGLTPELPGVSDGSAKAMGSSRDAELINSTTTGPGFWETVLNRMRPHGLSEQEMIAMRDNHPAARYCPSQAVPYQPVAEGDTLTYADFVLQVVAVPGHTPGQLSLYAPKQRFFFAGDHILGTITPNIAHWSGFPDALGQYLQSLEKIRRMDIHLTLTGHRALVERTTERIDELVAHHRKRLVGRAVGYHFDIVVREDF